MSCRFGVAVLMVLVSTTVAPKTGEKDLTEGERNALGKITPCKAFAYFSGNTERLNMHPAIYGYGEKGVEKVRVIGHACDEEFEISELDKAIKRYKELLKERGFRVR